jgi:multisubunit Na+/H+ antiporter MnhG subunit
VDTAGKQGWAYTSQAAVLVYLITNPETIYWISMHRLRKQLPRWETAYKTRRAQNEGYQTHGLLVPLDELERIAEAIW